MCVVIFRQLSFHCYYYYTLLPESNAEVIWCLYSNWWKATTTDCTILQRTVELESFWTRKDACRSIHYRAALADSRY